MNKTKLYLSLFMTMLLLVGCIPSLDNDDEVIQDGEEMNAEKIIIPEHQLKKEYYRTLLPFKQSASRGMVVNNLNTKYDIEEVEEGLLRLSAQSFSPEKYFFQEGQYITARMASEWLGRKSENNPDGLNPKVTEEMTDDDIAADAPIYLAHIVEQNYLTLSDDNKVKLEGISIGLAMNSIYYMRSGQEVSLTDKELEEKGMDMAEEIVNRMRALEGLENIPIVVGLFKQESNNAIVPGHYFATALAEGGKVPAGWKAVDDKYVLFPSAAGNESYREVNEAFQLFKQAIDEYVPSFVNIIGRGHYVDGNLQSLRIEVPIQFYGKSETIGFVQYMSGQIPKRLPNVPIEVSITSINGPEALIIKNPDEDEPFVHVYGY